MLRLLTAILTVAALVAMPSTVAFTAQDAEAPCSAFDTWQWAQTAFEAAPDVHASLDPDGDGIACPELPHDGFAPTPWANAIPSDAEPARVSSVVDGDTLDVVVDGAPETVRMYHINAPEVGGDSETFHCGGEEATVQLANILSLAPDDTVWLEYDETRRDQYDRRLAYVWFEVGDNVYMVNETLVRSGWAESETYGPDDRYRSELNDAEQFSVQHRLGVRGLCGAFGVEIEPNQQVQQATEVPNAPAYIAVASPEQSDAGCERSYPDACIPLQAEVGDLDCGDIDQRKFQVLPPDPHSFDSDDDGVGCEGD